MQKCIYLCIKMTCGCPGCFSMCVSLTGHPCAPTVFMHECVYMSVLSGWVCLCFSLLSSPLHLLSSPLHLLSSLVLFPLLFSSLLLSSPLFSSLLLSSPLHSHTSSFLLFMSSLQSSSSSSSSLLLSSSSSPLLVCLSLS